MNNFWQRTLYGALFVLAVLTSVLWSFYLFAFLFLLFGLGSGYEFNNLLKIHDKVVKLVNAFSVGGLFLTTALFFFDLIPGTLFLANLIFPLIIVGYGLKYHHASFKFFNTWLKTIIYPGLGFVAMALLMFNPVNEYHFSQSVFLAVLVMVWVNDTFAYLSGRLFGKTLIFPEVSPKKTWEGSIGGVVFTIISGAIFASSYSFMDLPAWIFFALITALSAIAGDYLASLLKRKAGVKDSGKFLPGHGGILDRLDSLIVTAPSIWLYLFLIANL
ncbi:MAG: phosphatidate cytidylyltransferase [Bacteroidota bacterium]